MKNAKRFYRLAAGLLLLLGLMVATAVPVFALAGEISLSLIDGPVGTRVTISGTGFTDGSLVTIHFGSVDIVPTNNRVDISSFSTYFIVPDLAPDLYLVSVTTSAGDTSDTKQFRIKVIINPVIAISPTTGHVGDTVTISGSGFTTNTNATIRFDGGIIGGPVPIGSDGSLPATTITIPEVVGGTHNIAARDSSDTTSPSISYTISPKIAITPNSGGVGDQVTVSGNGFGANQNLGVYFDNALVAAGVTASAQGVLPANIVFNIPPSSRGTHTVEVKGGSDSAVAIINVAQKITMSPLSGPVGTVVNVSGTGFTANQPLSVKFNSVLALTSPPSPVVAADGSFSASFTVVGAAGTYPVEVSDGTLSASRNFTLVVEGSLAPKEGNVGTTVSVNATGFTPNATVSITFDGTEVTTAKVAANGGFKASFPAPAVEGGEYQVLASDSVNSFSDTFTMESTAPTAPVLTTPKDKARAGRTPTFQWGAVSDPSGVTYNFQLASDAGFATLLFDQKGLTDIRFAITEAEKLEPAKKDAPYYWRVRAVDGASNESDWSTPFSFYTGINFSLPTWAIYVLIVVGALLIGFIGFWLGRRTAYY